MGYIGYVGYGWFTGSKVTHYYIGSTFGKQKPLRLARNP